MPEFFIKIKYKYKNLWRFIEFVNGIIFSILFGNRFNFLKRNTLNLSVIEGYTYRSLSERDLTALETFFKNQDTKELQFFETHQSDSQSLASTFKNPAVLMFGAFHQKKMVGYFLMRCFINKKCFIGRFIDKDHRNMGLGKIMNNILYNSAWKANFRCYSTFSKDNQLIMLAHANNKSMKIIRELENDYILVEFVPQDKS